MRYRRVARLSDDPEFHYRILAVRTYVCSWTLSYAAWRFDTIPPPFGIRAADTPCFPCLRGPNGFLIREHRAVSSFNLDPKLPDNSPRSSKTTQRSCTLSKFYDYRRSTNCSFNFNWQREERYWTDENGFNRRSFNRGDVHSTRWPIWLAPEYHELISMVENFGTGGERKYWTNLWQNVQNCAIQSEVNHSIALVQRSSILCQLFLPGIWKKTGMINLKHFFSSKTREKLQRVLREPTRSNSRGS